MPFSQTGSHILYIITLYRYQVLKDEKQIVTLLQKVKDLTSHYGHVNNGKGIDEVGERQKRRKLASLRETCKRALWFTDSFNVDLLGIIFKTKNTLEEISIDYNNPTISSSSSNSSYSIQTLLNLRHNSVRSCIFWIGLPCLMSSITNCRWYLQHYQNPTKLKKFGNY